MYRYPAVFEPYAKAGGFVVTFPDFGWGVTQGETIEEAMEMAEDALATIVADTMDRRQDLPTPGKARGKHIRIVSLPALANAKALLYTAMRAEKVRKAELARRLGVAKPQIDRLLDLKIATRFDQIEAAFQAIGKRIRIEVEEAA